MQLQQNINLKSMNTLALPSIAKQVVFFDHLDQLPALHALMVNAPRRWVIGGGSNLVLAAQIDALVIKMQNRGIKLIEETVDQVLVEAQAGEPWHEFVQYCLQKGWFGLENLALIPGTVGAAPVQNIGAYGVELAQFVAQVEVWDVEQEQLRFFSAADCEFAYRDSIFKRSALGRYLIVAVQFRLQKAVTWQAVLTYPDLKNHPKLQSNQEAQSVFDAVVQIRQTKLPDPQQLANAGSFFKNPIVSKEQYNQLREAYPRLVAYAYGEGQFKLAAGWLIEQAGWKGKQLGAIGMHKNQALVLVNYGGGSAQEVQEFVVQLKADVQCIFGVSLEQEPIAVM